MDTFLDYIEMADLHPSTLRNTDNYSIQNGDDDSTIRRVIADIERLMSMLNNELDQNRSSISTNFISYSPEQLKLAPALRYPSSSTTITSVTINDDNHRLIEHLRNRIAQLEHERNVLLTSYELLLKLLK